MNSTMLYIAAFAVCFFTTCLMTPAVIRLAYRFGMVDRPNERKVHARAIPRVGGLAIAAGVIVGWVLFPFSFPGSSSIAAGSAVILLTGFLDDRYNLSPLQKLAGQVAAAVIPIASGISINKMMLPFIGAVELDLMSYGITFFWILLVTNSINLIDGLDGLAAGISVVVLTMMLFVAIAQQQYFLIGYLVLLIGSILGFLVFNFHPAKLFMGDVGSLFLGYSIALLSVVGFFKGITITSVLIPVIMLAIPLSDTFFAVVRRLLNRQSIMAADKFHLHHCLLRFGFSHRTVVLMLYGASALFGIFAFFFPYYNYRSATLLFLLFLFIVEVLAELIGLIGKRRKPVLSFLKKIQTKLQEKSLG